jgi:membrane-associated protease RseP (regulator of RpoE activity)
MSESVRAWRTNAGLFVVTAISVFVTGVLNFPADLTPPKDEGTTDALIRSFQAISTTSVRHGAMFAGSLLTILIAHELGHWVAARIHKVEASLPFFIPMPILSPFGTMGAVIRMRGAIPTRRALLDIGAAGPLAGLAFALPLYAWGVAHSTLVPADPNGIELGESLLIKAFDHFFAPPVPEGMSLLYSPVAFGAWGGFFVTMINLIPIGQLDGGHVAYALIGPKQDQYAKTAHRAMLAFFGVIVIGHVLRDMSVGRAVTASLLGRYIGNAIFWLVWFEMLAILGALSARARGETPTLTIRTRLISTLSLFALAVLARERGSWLLIAGFFVGLALLLAMEIKGGVLRSHDLLNHPEAGGGRLDAKRMAVALLTLAFFALLFMPEPFAL